MGLLYKNVKPIKIYYQCDNCNTGFPEIIDTTEEKDDDGETHTIYTYRCPVCNIVENLEDMIFPYIDYIEYDDFLPYKI